MPRKTTVPFPEDKIYIKRDLRNGDQIDSSSPYIENGRVYRDIYEHPPLRDLIYQGLSQKLAKQGYLPAHRIDIKDLKRIEVEWIPWCVYPTEFSLRQLRDGLLQILELSLLLNPHGYTFRDISWRQVGMKFSMMPVLVDMGTISCGIGHYKNIMLKEILEWCTKIGFEPKSRTPKGILQELRSYYPRSPKNEWDTYDKSEGLADKNNPEIQFLQKWIEKVDINNVLDAGANRGRISKYLAMRLGMAVLACDTSDWCVTDLYLWAQKNHMPITSLKWDIMVPPKWINYEWMCCEALIASSLTHHLYRAGHDFVTQEKVFSQLGTKLILVEYIDPKDSHVRRWGVRWTQQEFEKAFSRHKLLDRVSLDPQNPHRFWYAYEVCGV